MPTGDFEQVCTASSLDSDVPWARPAPSPSLLGTGGSVTCGRAVLTRAVLTTAVLTTAVLTMAVQTAGSPQCSPGSGSALSRSAFLLSQ